MCKSTVRRAGTELDVYSSTSCIRIAVPHDRLCTLLEILDRLKVEVIMFAPFTYSSSISLSPIPSHRLRHPLLRGQRNVGLVGDGDGLQRAGDAARGALLQEHHLSRRQRQPELRRHELVGNISGRPKEFRPKPKEGVTKWSISAESRKEPKGRFSAKIGHFGRNWPCRPNFCTLN